MHELTNFEMASAFVILFLGLSIIVFLIFCGVKVWADAQIEEIQKSSDRRARRLARRMVRDWLNDVQIQVTQKIEVIEDDLKGGDMND